jgi:hypothetical protein
LSGAAKHPAWARPSKCIIIGFLRRLTEGFTGEARNRIDGSCEVFAYYACASFTPAYQESVSETSGVYLIVSEEEGWLGVGDWSSISIALPIPETLFPSAEVYGC